MIKNDTENIDIVNLTPEIKEEKKVNKTNHLADKFEFDRYYEEISEMVIEKDPLHEGKKIQSVIKRERFRPEYQNVNYLQKCKIRAARAFDVSIKHLELVYRALNGKKIDGIFINDIIDRYGFSNATCVNRADIIKRFGLSSIAHLEIAEENLRDIICKTDFISAYNLYTEKYLLVKESKDTRDIINL